MSRVEQWEKTLAFWYRRVLPHFTGPEHVELDHVGIVRTASKWTRIGDVLIPDASNGDNRWGFCGVTSKGRRLACYYQTIRRKGGYQKAGGRVEVFEVPGEVGKDPLGPGVRAFVLDILRAGDLPAGR